MNSLYFSAEYHTSATELRACPDAIAEVAFAGRSNAGKSSALNTITRNKKLARTSKTPGRTQLLNYFSLHDDRFLVDLPGYGYAEVSKSRQKIWQAALARYIERRECLKGLVLVMDIRHPLSKHDWTLIELQQRSQAELHVMLTKADKLGKSARAKSVEAVRSTLEHEGVEATLQDFSALKAIGVDDAHSILDFWLFNKPL
jgi:GTP-binding protein